MPKGGPNLPALTTRVPPGLGSLRPRALSAWGGLATRPGWDGVVWTLGYDPGGGGEEGGWCREMAGE